ncbi:MAG: hypothetical protein ACI85N_001157 [Gammaproteobacteria bacterium]|jgi:hypothetical protein
MSVLILQIIIKQWDKSQRTEAHVSERENRPDKYPIKIPPAFYVFDKQCVIDQHGDDLQGGRINYSQSTKGNIKLDRFQIDLNTKVLEYSDTSETDGETKTIGSLENSWIQCKYNWRYSIFENEMFYWLYEDITLNAICIKSLNENVFMNSEPAIVYEDI